MARPYRTHFDDLTNRKFGKLLVIERAEPPISDPGHVYWFCHCDCGGNKVVYASSLRNGDTQSCGCRYQEAQVRQCLPLETAALNEIFSNYKGGAKERSLAFELTADEFYALITKHCECCGIKPSSVWKPRKVVKGVKTKTDERGVFRWNGIDRIDNALGYTVVNTRTYCSICNMLRGAMPEVEWQAWLQRVRNNR